MRGTERSSSWEFIQITGSLCIPLIYKDQEGVPSRAPSTSDCFFMWLAFPKCWLEKFEAPQSVRKARETHRDLMGSLLRKTKQIICKFPLDPLPITPMLSPHTALAQGMHNRGEGPGQASLRKVGAAPHQYHRKAWTLSTSISVSLPNTEHAGLPKRFWERYTGAPSRKRRVFLGVTQVSKVPSRSHVEDQRGRAQATAAWTQVPTLCSLCPVWLLASLTATSQGSRSQIQLADSRTERGTKLLQRWSTRNKSRKPSCQHL